MRVLLTGGTGFLGSYVCQRLLLSNYSVDVAIRETSDVKRLESLVDHEYPKLQLVHYAKLDFSVGYDAVVHTATAYGRADHLASDVVASNILMPLRLLEECIKYNVGIFVNTDTYYAAANEGHQLQSYIKSKKDFANWGRIVADNKIRFVNMRMEHLYGVLDSPDKFCTKVIKECLQNKDRIALTVCDQSRDFINVKDAANAYAKVLESLGEFSHGWTEIGVGSGVAVSLKEYVTMAHKISGSVSILGFGDIQKSPAEIPRSRANNTFLTERGWTCEVGLETGIEEVVQYIREEMQSTIGPDSRLCG